MINMILMILGAYCINESLGLFIQAKTDPNYYNKINKRNNSKN